MFSSLQVELPGGVGRRKFHTASVVACAPGSVHLLLFGGNRGLGDPIAATTVVQMGMLISASLSPCSLQFR